MLFRSDFLARLCQVRTRLYIDKSRFAEFKSRFEKVKSRFAEFKSRFDGVNSWLEKVKSRFAEFISRFDGVNSWFEIGKPKLAEMKPRDGRQGWNRVGPTFDSCLFVAPTREPESADGPSATRLTVPG